MDFKELGSYLVFIALICCVSSHVKREYVVTGDKQTAGVNSVGKNVNGPPEIYEMLLDASVTNRYAKVLVISKIGNWNTKAQETTFSLVIPENAFISNFSMEIDNKRYEAFVQEKEQAKKTYLQAVTSGTGAAHVNVRDSNIFTVSVNIQPQSKAIFYLQYEELLVRKMEIYELVLNIYPGQLVEKMAVVVNLRETRPLRIVKIPALRSGNELTKNNSNANPAANIQIFNDSAAIVTFKPNVVKQRILSTILGGKEDNGLRGQFVVQYDVIRDPLGGEVLVDGDYFVHFFAPKDLTPVKKQVVFVLDASYSMRGRKIEQLKEAMKSILDELNPEDTFSILDFSDVVSVWNIEQLNIMYQEGTRFPGDLSYLPHLIKLSFLPDSFLASPENIKKAKQVIDMLQIHYGTDILRGLNVSLALINQYFHSKKRNHPIIVFLTDGEPTYGTTQEITSVITKANINKIPIYALSFGLGANKLFLQEISLLNHGFSRHIYEAADAGLQLRNFYQEISSPLLTNVRFKYVSEVKNVTRTQFPVLFKGSELYTAGKIDSGFKSTTVEALGRKGPVNLQSKVYQSAGSLERLWAYLSVKQLLEQSQVATDKESLTNKALAISLAYSFVTKITSLVVVKPSAASVVELENAWKGTDPPSLTWIQNVIYNNWILTIKGRNYELGLSEVLGKGQTCHNSVDGQAAHCMLVHECLNVHSYLTDFVTYEKYFCEQKSYAGVCCSSV
ncbi:hypothetical protein GWI33_007165 [Rhynchophorus ferrugineus]|uniref:Uncharacterized protein n=1 Tax=Rhynchophorus ferrugineus TaxID=354439 RepID=A0A834IYM5_RHYFE|nr:hypothetical protein GWI33_007165 [Rhynchophorus ferrugineus]